MFRAAAPTGTSLNLNAGMNFLGGQEVRAHSSSTQSWRWAETPLRLLVIRGSRWTCLLCCCRDGVAAARILAREQTASNRVNSGRGWAVNVRYIV